MDWKQLAIAPRRKLVASALVYGLSLTVRFTSPTAEEARSVQSSDLPASILIGHEWPGRPMMPAALRGWPLGPRICRAACEGPSLLSSLRNCAAP